MPLRPAPVARDRGVARLGQRYSAAILLAGRELLAGDAEKILVDFERFDRRVGAVAERRVDRIATVGPLRRAVAAAEDLEIDAVALVAEIAEAERGRAVVAGGDHLVGQRLG